MATNKTEEYTRPYTHTHRENQTEDKNKKEVNKVERQEETNGPLLVDEDDQAALAD